MIGLHNGKLKHVIFLGAGASQSSGYPIGQDLRLLISSQTHLQEKLTKLFQREFPTNFLLDFFESIKLFRYGGFATVDEFSKLASESYPEHVQKMKILVRLVLALDNPENNFQNSDYYPFIQRLFRKDEMIHFRNEISIISFNYDCYLDFLLRQAYSHRTCLSKITDNVKNNPLVLKGPQEDIMDPWSAKLSSGFYEQHCKKELAWRLDQFNYFKLHGSMSYGNDPTSGYKVLFRPGNLERFGHLATDHFQKIVPPIVFPWELFTNEGEFIPEDEFIYVKGERDPQKQLDGRQLFKHFNLMWKNAKLVVENANKISFVGLSMHDYLKSGFNFLFKDFGKFSESKQKLAERGIRDTSFTPVEVVVANTDNENYKNAETTSHPNSPCGKVLEFLVKNVPNLNYLRSSSEFDGILKDNPGSSVDVGITPRYSFSEFIQREMGQ
jgi:hypothetical protein